MSSNSPSPLSVTDAEPSKTNPAKERPVPQQPAVASSSELSLCVPRDAGRMTIAGLLNPAEIGGPSPSHQPSSSSSKSVCHLFPVSSLTALPNAELDTPSHKKYRRSYRRLPKEDVNAPKKPRTAYLSFVMDNRDKVARCNSDFGSVAKMLGKMWQELDPRTREQYFAQHAAELLNYNKALDQYKNTPEYWAYQQYLHQFMHTEEKAPRPVGRPRKHRPDKFREQTFQLILSPSAPPTTPHSRTSSSPEPGANPRSPAQPSTSFHPPQRLTYKFRVFPTQPRKPPPNS
ncbi:hypothetical protein H4R35_002367 [Dimargaris xerosporica]|nr:hypothetical protein H4R35_002367 [Dimargaris xerosporica]